MNTACSSSHLKAATLSLCPPFQTLLCPPHAASPLVAAAPSPVLDPPSPSNIYLDGGGRVQHVLEGEVAAAVEVVPAEVPDELQVVQAVGQGHVLLQAHIWMGAGVHGVRGRADQGVYWGHVNR